MRRVASLTILIAVSAAAMEFGISAQAQDSADWRMYSDTGDLAALYSVPSIVREKGSYVRVWAEIIKNADIDHSVASIGKHTQPLVGIVSSRIRAGYVPPFVLALPHFTTDQVINITLAEEIANERLAPTMTMFLTELDCAKKRSRVLQLTDYSNDGTPARSRTRPSAWQYVGPQTVGEKLLRFVCRPQLSLPAPGGSSDQSNQH
jgi:surface-adhesin protein E